MIPPRTDTNGTTWPLMRLIKDRLKALRKLGPTSFAEKVAASVESLTALKWHPATEGVATPASKPDGDRFDVFFVNRTKRPVRLSWMDRTGMPKLYGTIEPGKRKRQQTRPGAVWLIADEADQPLGYFRIGDRTARGDIPTMNH